MVRRTHPPDLPRRTGVHAWAWFVRSCCGLVLALATATAHAQAQTSAQQQQAVELATLQTSRSENSLNLEFAVRLNLPRTVEDAMQRGVPVYFVAQAQLLRSRWYWRDQRIARVQRSWRVAYQPLTSTWRVGLGGLNQTHATLHDALAAVSRSAGWRLADISQLDSDESYYIDFSYRLDSSQLPGPMQIGLGGQNDWAVGLNRVLRLDMRFEPGPENGAATSVSPAVPVQPPLYPPEPKPEGRPESKPELRPEARPDARPEARADGRPFVTQPAQQAQP